MLAPGAAGRVLSRALSLSHGPASVVVERVWPVPLGRAGASPRLHPRRHRVYRVLRDGKHLPRGDMELLLSQAVQDLGSRGDVVRVRKSLGRNKLLPQGLAVYPSPENLRLFQQEKEVNGLDTVRVPMDVVQFLHPKTKRFRHWQQQQQQQLESSRERLL